MSTNVVAPDLFDKNGKQIPRSKYLDENGYAVITKLYTFKNGSSKPAFKAFDKDGKPVDLGDFYNIYCKHSVSDFIVCNENGHYLDLNRVLAFKKSSVAKKTIHTTKFFEKEVEITDPCYPKADELIGIRLAMPIKTGDYDCVTWKHIEDGDSNDGRTMIIGIYLNGVEPDLSTAEVVGRIAVDTASAGFFMNKPDYTEEEWDRYCRSDFESVPGCYDLPWEELMRIVHEKDIDPLDVHITKEGFDSSIGWGDGSYDVLGYKVNGEFVAFEIIG